MTDARVDLRLDRPAAGPAAVSQARTGPWPAKLLLFTLAVPFFFPVGPLFLTADRFLLLLLFLPCMKIWLSGGAGRIILPDIALILFCLWTVLSMVVVDGASSVVEASGINTVETLGAYLVGRCFVRSAADFRSVARFLVLMILAMLPFALHETLTGQNYLLSVANKVWPSYADVPKEPRWGLDRVALTFYHPILFGVFCGSGFAICYFVLGYDRPRIIRIAQTALVALVATLSLSSGPLTALVSQASLIAWDSALHRFRKRWTVLLCGVGTLWISLEIAANRSVPELFLTYFAFNPSTAYNRIRIWEFGVLSIQQHPLFGIGLSGDWVRPWWMGDSMDMFWIVSAVRHGLPAGLLMHLAFMSMVILVALKPRLGDRDASYRLGFLVCMTGFYLAGWTVHYWKVIYVLFMLLLGSGAWLLGASDTQKSEETDSAPREAGTRSRRTWSRDTEDYAQRHPKYTRSENSSQRRKT
ncbi:O-antigen polymerase [Roseivivax marinus]|uniref:O-antigen polymerase n=1 Tax=Roseivivax marinus TaxID=1379903 RepID=W4HKD7_9RHOB|nr:hypothetical protein [Roseivivax marinus]ETW13194.1 O-antigen polymerase [Roseivivax marinus]